MVKNERDGQTFNAAIQAASNYIGQKLFAYISHGKNINSRIREKFAKSMIFIGDEGQIYNPLTNTYIGIGQTAYTNAVSYIEEAHEKIDSLNKMLTSSMVTSIYANWDEDTWRDMTYVAEGSLTGSNNIPGVTGETTFKDVLPTKIFATNDIVLRGIGDYDPETKLAYTREFAHITDSNLAEGDKAAKKALEGSYIQNTSDAAFATSGITVSLEKGLNKYMFTYTFRHPLAHAVPGADPTIWTKNDVKSTIDEKESSNYAEKVTFYLTIDEVKEYVKAIVETKPGELKKFIIPGTNKEITKDSVDRKGTNGKKETIENPLLEFWKGVVPVWDDEVFGRTVKYDTKTKKWIFYANKEDKDQVKVDYWFLGDESNSNYWTKREFLSHQLFKQGKNVMTIDDKLTWSYISSAYSYALDFSKEYTDSQVERIYRELLGSSNTLLIPCSTEQVKVQQINPDATKTLDLVNVVWDETNAKWVTKPRDIVANKATGDGLKDYSENLTQYKLNEGSIYVTPVNVPANTDLNTFDKNTTYITADGDVVLPWFILTYLSKMSEQYMKDYNACYAKYPEVHDPKAAVEKDGKVETPAIPYKHISDGKNHYRYAETYKDKLINSLSDHTFSWVSGKSEDGKTDVITTWSTPDVSVENAWDKVFFMNYERDSNYPEELSVDNKSIKISEDWYGDSNFVRSADTVLSTNNNDLSYYDNGKQPANGEFGVPVGPGGSAWSSRAIHNHGYLGKKYSLNVVYKIVDELSDFCNAEKVSDTTTHEDKPLFVVNTKWTSLNNVNLADGIQTLKEITYVLDIITDGWGNHYEDAEGNGILLTYTIANNHDRIVDHEKRLKQIESGTNVVKGIGRLDHMMSKYVDLQLTSDVLWKFKNIDNNVTVTVDEAGNVTNITKSSDEFHLASDKNDKGEPMNEFANYVWASTYYGKNDTTKYGLPETTGFVGITTKQSKWSESKQLQNTENGKSVLIGSTPHEFKYGETGYANVFKPDGTFYNLQQIPVSYIVAYNSYVRNWTKDRDFRNQMGIALDTKWQNPNHNHPIFSDVFPSFATIGIINCNNDGLRETTQSGQNSSYVFTSPEGRFMAIHSYVGHVGVGIDLKLAQTYTTSNIQGGESGFVCVDIRSSIIKKKVNVHAKLPKHIATDSNITWKGVEPDINNNGKRYEKAINSAEKLTDTDKALLIEKLTDMGLTVSDIKTFDSVLVTSDDSYGATFTFDFVINVNKAIDSDNAYLITGRSNYDGRLYANVNYGEITYETTGSGETAVTTYFSNPNFATYYNIYSSIDPKDIHNASSYYRIPAAKQELIIPSDYNGQTKFFVRFNHTTDVLAVDLEYDGLTTTNWVATYVAATVDSVSKQLKAVEYESYRFAENLINGLDNSVYGSRGKFVSGIEQRNGIVTPIYKDLPKDELLASYSVWGENTDVKRNYQKVTTDDIYKQEVLHGSLEIEYPLYIAPEGKFTYVMCTPDNIPTYISGIDTQGKVTFNTNDTTYTTYTDNWVSYHGVIKDSSDVYIYTFDEKTNEYVKFKDDYLKANFEFDSELSKDGTSGKLLLSSWKVGEKYGMYVPMYFKVQAYERINPAQLHAEGATKENKKVPTHYSFTVGKGADAKIYTTEANATINTAIYTVIASTAKERKYITASAEYSDQTEIGNGKNTLQITAHITKLIDADKDNSGLVDAYDVKTTINSMFEWVDLSRWDLDNKEGDEINPLNSPYREEDGNYSDAFRIANSAAMGVPVYPRESFNVADYISRIGYERLPNDVKTAMTSPEAGDKFNTNPTAKPTEATSTPPATQPSEDTTESTK